MSAANPLKTKILAALSMDASTEEKTRTVIDLYRANKDSEAFAAAVEAMSGVEKGRLFNAMDSALDTRYAELNSLESKDVERILDVIAPKEPSVEGSPVSPAASPASPVPEPTPLPVRDSWGSASSPASPASTASPAPAAKKYGLPGLGMFRAKSGRDMVKEADAAKAGSRGDGKKPGTGGLVDDTFEEVNPLFNPHDDGKPKPP